MGKSKKAKIAIVGIGLRLPKDVSTLGDLWNVLHSGENLISHVDQSRFDFRKYTHGRKTELGKSYAFKAGMLSNIHDFDAQFFGISPREACQMDPQQRLLLETTWEALENGGQHIDRQHKKKCAVFVGIGSTEHMFQYTNDPSTSDSYSMLGSCTSIASNRLSYFFNFQGPSMSIDTACSSSLVALHQACENIRSGDVSMAIAAGVNLLQSPTSFIGFSKASMLSPDGQCKSFSAEANGYVRSEGCVVLFLKSLEQAERDGDPIHAVILNTGVNNDGKTNGIILPSGDSQAELVSRVHDQAGIHADDIAYIEAHGTGTLAGDQAESHGLHEAIAKKRSKKPLLIGSIKSNLGHLECASGLTGVLKTILCLQHKKIPKTMHFDKPNPHISFDEMNLKVINTLTDIPEQNEPLIMGVNSFGFGGTNAHALLSETSKKNSKQRKKTVTPPLFLTLNNTKNKIALFQQYVKLIRENINRYYDIAHTLYHRKTKHQHGIAIYGSTPESIVTTLEQVINDDIYSPQIVSQNKLGCDLPTALIYSGNGCQWQGMGAELINSDPIFKKTIHEIDALFLQYSDFSIKQELLASAENSRYDQTEIAQPCLFALQVATTRYLQHHGIKIHAVAGHSVGEIAAAWASGALTLEQATEVIYQRSFWQGKTHGQGRMMAVGISTNDMQAMIAKNRLEEKVEIAAINSLNAVTIAGDLSSLQKLQTVCDETLIFNKLLDLDYAFHTKAMDPIKTGLLNSLKTLTPKENNIAYVSTVTGTILPGNELDAEYWWKNIREPVQFHSAIETLITQDNRIFIEIGPHPVLKTYIEECLKAEDVKGAVFSTGKRKANQIAELNNGLYKAWLCGASVNHQQLFPHAATPITLPPQIWSKQTFRLPSSSEDTNQINLPIEHPLLGWRIKKNESTWENHVDTLIIPYLADHVVNETAILPAAGFCEMAMAASHEYYGTQNHDIRDLEIISPLVFEEGKTYQTRFELHEHSGDFVIKSRLRHQDSEWNTHAVGRILPKPVLIKQCEKINVAMNQAETIFKIDGNELYRMAKSARLEYGPLFQTLSTCCIQKNKAQATLQLSTEIQILLESHRIYPGILDACFQLLIGVLTATKQEKETYLPVRIGRLELLNSMTNALQITATIIKRSKHSVLAHFAILDSDGNMLARATNCRFKKAHFSSQTKQICYVAQPHLLASFEDPIPHHFSDIENIQKNVFAQLISSSHTDRLNTITPLFDLMIVYFIYEVFIEFVEKKSFSMRSLIENSHITASHILFLKWCISVLQNHQLIECNSNNQYALVLKNNTIDAAQIWKQLLESHPKYLTELLFVGRLGTHLKSILTNQSVTPFQLASLFHPDQLSYLRDDSPSASVMNQGVFSTISTVIEKYPDTHKIRILDIGYGISSLSKEFIHRFANNQIEYVLLVEDAGAKIALENYHNVTIITITENTWTSELPTRSFDIILVRNYLHTAKNIIQHLTALRKRLVNHGLLFLLGSADDYLQNFIFGLEPNWLCETQDHESYSPLLSAIEWKSYLEKSGFLTSQPSYELGGSESEGMFLLSAQSMLSDDKLEKLHVLENEVDNKILVFTFENASEILSQLQLKSSLNTLSIPNALSENAQIEFFTQAFKAYHQHLQLLRIVCVFNSHVPDENARLCTLLSGLIKAIHAIKWHTIPQFMLITQDAIPTKYSHANNPAQSMLWGFGRVIQNEYKNLNCKLIDIQGQITEKLINKLASEIRIADHEQEIILTERGRYGFKVEEIEPFLERKTTHQNYFLDFKRSGSLKNLCWSPAQNIPLLPDEVRLKPIATGLNFRDLMYAMGLIPDEAVENGFLGATLGMEFSGEVLAVGDAVTDFKIGDRVMGFAPASFATMTVTKAHAITHLPQNWTHEEAATIPIAFFTAYYALHHLAHMQAGERVLIHGAAGGLGIAAIQIANHIGAEVFATAGSASKQDFLKLMGVPHRYDSRSLHFADEILRDTNGEGVDVILNCLAGEAITANLSIIKPFGRFLEVGKRDFFANSKMGLRPFRNNISYFGIDADQLLIEKPVLCVKLFRDMMRLFENNSLTPLPCRIFGTKNIEDTFRYMQQSRHIGKIVVKLDESELRNTILQTREISKLALSSDATYLVTGGLRGFGLETAKWLAQKGARHLVLVGRSGTVDDETRKAFDQLQMNGVAVTVYACDVSDTDAVKKMIESFATNPFPLKGIVHAAAIYEDALIQNLTDKKIQAVIQSKAIGGWNLHCATEKLKLDFFVAYSSVTTLFGNSGQASYVAANTYLESLISYRHQRGLPGLFIAWGPIADAGYLARNEKIKDMLVNKLGDQLLTTHEAFEFLEKLMQTDVAGVSVANLNFRKMHRSVPILSSPKYNWIISKEDLTNGASTDSSLDVRSLISEKSEREAITIIGDLLSNEISRILQLPADKLDKKMSLINYGMDSLVGVELAHAIQDRFSVQLPVMSLSQNIHIDAISERIFEALQDHNNQSNQPDENTVTIDKNISTAHEPIMNKIEETMDSTV